jgi:hypothetical protein
MYIPSAKKYCSKYEDITNEPASGTTPELGDVWCPDLKSIQCLKIAFLIIYATFQYGCLRVSPALKEVKKVTLGSRVARFFLVQYTKTGENIPNDYKIYQMAIRYSQWPLK